MKLISFGTPGHKATVKLISARFFWLNITTWTHSCVSCQKSKVHKHINKHCLRSTPIVTRSDAEPDRLNGNRSSFVYRLQAYFGNLPPMHPREQTIKSSVLKDICSWTHVFLRKDAGKAPLTPLYTGPYCVLSRTDKHFTLDIRGKKETVSIDRVKRDFLNTNTQEPHIRPTYTHEHTLTPIEGNTTTKDNYVTTTRSGRRVHWPKKLCKTVYV